MTTQILVCCHKADKVIRHDTIYRPIHVGHALSDKQLGFDGDDKVERGGGNISHLNRSYCELTALYWAYKEMTPVDFVGLAHYRRYFADCVTDAFVAETLATGKYDIITCLPMVLPHSNYMELCYWIGPENVYILIDTILGLRPEMAGSIQAYCFKSIEWIPCNMFISSWQWMQEYSEWLFAVLAATEKRLRPAAYSREGRAIGYMGEFLLGLYIQHTQAKACEVEMVTYRDHYVIHSSEKRYKKMFARRRLADKILNANMGRAIKRLLGIRQPAEAPYIPVEDAVMAGLRADGILLEAIERLNHSSKQ